MHISTASLITAAAPHDHHLICILILPTLKLIRLILEDGTIGARKTIVDWADSAFIMLMPVSPLQAPVANKASTRIWQKVCIAVNVFLIAVVVPLIFIGDHFFCSNPDTEFMCDPSSSMTTPLEYVADPGVPVPFAE